MPSDHYECGPVLGQGSRPDTALTTRRTLECDIYQFILEPGARAGVGLSPSNATFILKLGALVGVGLTLRNATCIRFRASVELNLSNATFILEFGASS